MSMATLEIDAAALAALAPERQAEFLRLMALAFPERSRWYCDRERCDGNPHTAWHWCEHPIGRDDPHPDGGEAYRACRHARWQQCPPAGEWRTWLLQAGRGNGKTRAGAEWLAHEAKRQPQTGWAVVAPTRDDLKSVCIEGESGLLAALGMARTDPSYNRTDLVLRLPNGSTIRGLSAEKPERMRGHNLMGAWLDEVGIWRDRATYDDLLPALRHGAARVVATSTPRSTPLFREWVARTDGSVVVTKGTTWDNAANLSPAALNELRIRYEGTERGRQELGGELLDGVAGALWTRSVIESTRVTIEGLPDLGALEARQRLTEEFGVAVSA